MSGASVIQRRRRAAATLGAGALAVLGVVLIARDCGDAAVRQPAASAIAERRLDAQRERSQAAIEERMATRMRERRAIAATRTQTPVVRFAGPGRKRVALTFDDGPGPDTERILDVLRDAGAQSTFFVLGGRVRGREATLHRIVAEGHEIGDHTWSHGDLTRLSRRAQRAEIRSQAYLIERLGLPRPLLMRPPYGAFDQRTMLEVKRAGMLVALWSVDPEDYDAASARQLRRAVLRSAGAGSIVLLHDGPASRAVTLRALPSLIRALKQRGYRLVTASTLIASSRPPTEQDLGRVSSGDSRISGRGARSKRR